MSEPINEVAMLEAALEQGLQLRRSGQGEAALEVLELILGHFEAADHPVAHQAVSRAMLGRAMALVDLDREPDALEALDALLARIRGLDNAVHHELRILAAYEAAIILGGPHPEVGGDHDQAAQGFAFVIDQAKGDEPPALVHILAAAHLKLAAARLKQDDPAAAIAALDAQQARWAGSQDASLHHWLAEGSKMRAALRQA